jgi:hypothetical protein
MAVVTLDSLTCDPGGRGRTMMSSGLTSSVSQNVFFGASTHHITHVGIVVDTGVMIDAPHTGAVVREERIWPYVGATRPANPAQISSPVGSQ